MAFRKSMSLERRRGFTLIEVVVAVFIFIIIMMTVSQIFISAFREYNYAKFVQRDLEAAQFAVNTIAKELRTGSVVSVSGVQTSVRFFDHSQGICFLYQFSGAELQMQKFAEPTNLTEIARQVDCAGHTFAPAAFIPIASGITYGRFRVVPSDGTTTPKVMGKVTMTVQIGEGAVHRANMQTTASLRDFGSIGL